LPLHAGAFPLTELQHLDRTPYTAEQLAWLRGVTAWFPKVWHETSKKCVELRSSPGRFRETYALTIDGVCWMTAAPPDLLDHRVVLDDAFGDVVLTGLGMGVALVFADRNQRVKSVTVVERDQRVADLVLPMVTPHLRRLAPTLVMADADAYDPKRRFDFAFLDHAYEDVSTETIARFCEFTSAVVSWWDERQEVEASWR